MAKSRFVVRTTALETGLGQLTSNSSRRRSGKQRDRTPLWYRQQQDSSGCVKSLAPTPKLTSQAIPTAVTRPGAQEARRDKAT